MGIEQDKEREHINEQLKVFDHRKIQIIAPGVSNYHNSSEHKSYITSTKRGAKAAKKVRGIL